MLKIVVKKKFVCYNKPTIKKGRIYMKTLKKKFIAIITLALTLCVMLFSVGCNKSDDSKTITNLQNKIAELEQKQTMLENKNTELEEKQSLYDSVYESDYVSQCYAKIKYIDKNLSDRDCMAGENFKATQQWIKNSLVNAGYNESDVQFQTITFNKYKTISSLDSFICDYTTDGKKYKKEGRNYVEAEDGTYTYVTVSTENIVLKKEGAEDKIGQKSGKQIIVGAHYDGDGTGDNGSGIALLLTVAQKLVNAKTPHDIVFIFFTAEEYGCLGSTAYANAMTQQQIDNTLYMINMDSLICGDYCYLYGGVQDDATKTVSGTAAYDNAMKVAESLGLDFKSNPWTYDNPAPGYDSPDYASPSTGDWSDHKGFKNIGIDYLYFEATNWEIPGPYDEYDGYGETYLYGMLMNTSNDYLEFIETYFPGRAQDHLNKFFKLLNALLMQNYQKV